MPSMATMLTPKEAADALKISTATITRCVKMGAPVYRWGASGKRYRICLEDFIAWMNRGNPTQSSAAPIAAVRARYDTEEMARQRRELVRGTPAGRLR